ILITIMLVNNETGTIQPIEEIAKIARKKGITLHSDAVQGVGKIPVEVNRLGVDLLSIAGHKLYGPRGIGALYVKKGTPLSSILHGGSQENGMRPGTQNTPGIVGFGKACACAMEGIEGNMRYISELKDLMEKTITKEIPDIRIHAQWAERIPHTTSIAFPGIMAMDLVAALDAHKIYASAGAACTSKKMTPSHVLSAMGVSGQDAFETLRLSLGWENKRSGIKRALKQLAIQAKRLKAFGISDKYHLIAFNDMEGLRDAEKILDTNSIEFALIATPAGTAHMNCCSTSIVVKDRSVAASTLGSNGVDIAGIHKISG
ncbi:MAG: aminotransferase class V-fold PLP-dependent enzyme, partial [Thermodesulfobacteriota bacterium]|nr:aminotransferase class V-fold PLP-dependent enzyme [Thermodesulfobacteriota bacterium]